MIMAWVFFVLADPFSGISAEELSAETGVDTSQVQAFLEAFTAEWHSQLDFRRPGEPNVFRRRPGFRLPEGGYSIALPWSILHEVIPWFKGEVESRGLDGLRTAYFEIRGEVVEEIVFGALSRVFGPDRVHANVEYRIADGNYAELDVLVDLDSHAIVVEAKSKALHDAYRRGDPGPIEHHVADLVEAPLLQSERAADYLLNGNTTFRYKGTRETFELASAVDSVDRVAVSLERIDPLVFLSGELLAHGSVTVWFVSLPDLLAVAEILDAPETLATYVSLRTSLGGNAQVRVYVETDVLGAFLLDGLASFIEVSQNEQGVRALLGYHSDEVNSYFTAQAAGELYPKPVVELPAEETTHLERLYNEHATDWHSRAVAAVMQHLGAPDAWSQP